MTDWPEAFKPLASQLYRRLELKVTEVRRDIRAAESKYASRGLGTSGALALEILDIFEAHCTARVQMLEDALRAYRLSCSPRLIVECADAMPSVLESFVNQACTYIHTDCEPVTSRIVNRLSGGSESLGLTVKTRYKNVTGTCCALASALWGEIVMGAKLDIEAKNSSERPTYSTVVNAPVGAIAQGSSSISNVSQSNGQTVNLDEIAALISAAKLEWSFENQQKIAAAEEVLRTEKNSATPDMSFVRAALIKVGKLASQAVVGTATALLVAKLKADGFMP